MKTNPANNIGRPIPDDATMPRAKGVRVKSVLNGNSRLRTKEQNSAKYNGYNDRILIFKAIRFAIRIITRIPVMTIEFTIHVVPNSSAILLILCTSTSRKAAPRKK